MLNVFHLLEHPRYHTINSARDKTVQLFIFITATSVSVGVWTLVAISVERYYAICHPLRSLRWQTLSHAYKLIIAIWIGSLICMAPIAVLSQLKPTKQGKCTESLGQRKKRRKMVGYHSAFQVELLSRIIVSDRVTNQYQEHYTFTT